MANSGINKAKVKKARTALITRGIHPSIDAVRVELGNTGSKTTITKYLNELQDEEAQKLGNANTLGEALQNMVADLATQLQQEAQAVVTASKEVFQIELTRLKGLLAEKDRQLIASQEQCRSLKTALTRAEDASEKSSKAETELIIKIERQAQQLNTQSELIEQKDAHIRSLEEKHHHARDSLEHYRTSVKDQREQEERRHERQVQQLQAEIRQFGQTVSIKQNDITQLTKDNARLASELTELGKQFRASEQQSQSLTIQLKSVENSLVVTNTKLEQVEQQRDVINSQATTLIGELANLRQASTSLQTELASTKTELLVKNQLFEVLQQRWQ